MHKDLLDTLLQALALSPENQVLRRQVAEGLLESERWQELSDICQPLLRSEQRAFALHALAKVAFHAREMPEAYRYYQEAAALDSRFVDERFEADLDPEPLTALPEQETPEPSGRVREYHGPCITFTDVGGMEALKEQIRLNILYPFTHPELYAAYGKKIGGGILLFGPPGCGKTHIARATAGELGANFYLLELNDVLSMWMGESEKRLHELFETARANAPSVIFIDEVDALGARRGEVTASPVRLTISQLLTEMDGIGGRNHQVLVLGATNEPWNVDTAFRRPGRFDRVLFVPPPDDGAREEILRIHARGRKFDERLSWRILVEKTDQFSGADLAALLDRACELVLGEALRSGNMREVNLSDCQKALRNMRPSTTEWLRRSKNYVSFANQDGFYDNLSSYLNERKIR